MKYIKMLTADSKVFELFAEIATAYGKTTSVNGISVSDCYDMLRMLINDDIISGKMSLGEFYDIDSVHVWMGYLANEYTSKQVQAFYDVLVNVDTNFDIENAVDDDSDSNDSDDSDYEEDEEDEDEEMEEVNRVIENDMKKEKWSTLMRPILNEFASEFLDMLWDHFANDDKDTLNMLPKAVYTIGQALYSRSKTW